MYIIKEIEHKRTSLFNLLQPLWIILYFEYFIYSCILYVFYTFLHISICKNNRDLIIKMFQKNLKKRMRNFDRSLIDTTEALFQFFSKVSSRSIILHVEYFSRQIFCSFLWNNEALAFGPFIVNLNVSLILLDIHLRWA